MKAYRPVIAPRGTLEMQHEGFESSKPILVNLRNVDNRERYLGMNWRINSESSIFQSSASKYALRRIISLR